MLLFFVPVLTRSEFADFYNARVNGTPDNSDNSPPPNISHQAQAGNRLSDFQQLSRKLYYSFNKKIDCCRLL